MNSTNNSACESCKSPCATCDKNDGDKCTSCIDDKHYINSVNNSACELCISPCYRCDPNDGNKCTGC